MAASDPRKMALQIAGLRANETHLPENERVFEDPYAEWFFPEDVRRKMLQDPARVKAERAKYESDHARGQRRHRGPHPLHR